MAEERASKGRDFLALVNPALVLSAAAEGLAGAVMAAPFTEPAVYILPAASAALFGAGSLFAHYFDREADAKHAPDRPLPAGRIEPADVFRVGLVLLGVGVLLALLCGQAALLAAMGVALAVVLYAAVAKEAFGGSFLALGAARALNLALGLAASPAGLSRFHEALLPVFLYAVGWGILRASRQPGAPPMTGFVGLLHIGAGVGAALWQAMNRFTQGMAGTLFLLAFVGLTLPRFVRAVMEPRRPHVVEAVQYGFLGLTLLEAGLTAGYAGPGPAVAVAAFGLPLLWALKRWPVSLVLHPPRPGA